MEPGPDQPQPDPVPQARADLEAALQQGRTGLVALAHLSLGTALAAEGAHEQAQAELAALLDYLALAARDDERETRRRLRMLSPAAPPPTADDIDLAMVAVVARLARAESLLALGQRAEAQAEAEAAAPGTRGLGRGPLRRRLAEVRRRLAEADDPAAATRAALQAIEACAPDDDAGRARARQNLAAALEELGRPADARRTLADSLTDYLTADDAAGAANVAVALSWRLADSGDPGGAIAVLRRTLAATERAPAQVRVQLLIDLGSLLDATGETSEARTTLTAAAAAAESAGDPLAAADARHGLAVTLATRPADADDSVEALALLDACRRDYTDLGHPDRAVGCDHEAAALLGRLGSAPQARARYERALAAYLALPPEARDTGSWPDEVADCELNLAALAEGAVQQPGPGLFRSGGHSMAHPPVITDR